MSDDILSRWDDLKDNLPHDDAAAAEKLFDFGDEMADHIAKLEALVKRAQRLDPCYPKSHHEWQMDALAALGEKKDG